MPAAATAADPLRNSPLMRALRRESTDRTPVWLMRQAGRYLPEYAVVRRGHAFEEFCKRPDLAAQVTLEAQAVLGVDRRDPVRGPADDPGAAGLLADLRPRPRSSPTLSASRRMWTACRRW